CMVFLGGAARAILADRRPLRDPRGGRHCRVVVLSPFQTARPERVLGGLSLAGNQQVPGRRVVFSEQCRSLRRAARRENGRLRLNRRGTVRRTAARRDLALRVPLARDLANPPLVNSRPPCQGVKTARNSRRVFGP